MTKVVNNDLGVECDHQWVSCLHFFHYKYTFIICCAQLLSYTQILNIFVIFLFFRFWFEQNFWTEYRETICCIIAMCLFINSSLCGIFAHNVHYIVKNVFLVLLTMLFILFSIWFSLYVWNMNIILTKIYNISSGWKQKIAKGKNIITQLWRSDINKIIPHELTICP